MKKALFPVVALILGTIGVSSVNAAPAPGAKRPGPSAVQAARLKKYPAPSYLSHYLPDDRYKIAGGVWKYVSTDLDTYYHVPNSPNMLRQPANRVIGFANARDAEEAGYVADPTDGTASKAAPSASITSGKLNELGLNEAEDQFLKSAISLLTPYGEQIAALDNKALQIMQAHVKQNGGGNLATLTASVRPVVSEQVKVYRAAIPTLARLKPPSRLKPYYNGWSKSLKIGLEGTLALERGLANGNMNDIAKSMQIYAAARKAREEAWASVEALKR